VEPVVQISGLNHNCLHNGYGHLRTSVGLQTTNQHSLGQNITTTPSNPSTRTSVSVTHYDRLHCVRHISITAAYNELIINYSTLQSLPQ